MCGTHCTAINNDAKYQDYDRIRWHKLSRLADSTQRDNDSSSHSRRTHKNYQNTDASHWSREDRHRGTCRRSGCQFPHPFSDVTNCISESAQRYPAARHRHYRCRGGFTRFPRPVQRSKSGLSVYNPQSCIPFRTPAKQYLFFSRTN